MPLARCPQCGSPLECRDGLTRRYCLSPDCGAVFHDLNLQGAATRLAADPAGEARADETADEPRD